MQRGNCKQCGQKWVLGKVDTHAGEFGLFFCCACWERLTDIEENDSEAFEATDSCLSKHHQSQATRAFQVGLPETRRTLNVMSDSSSFRGTGSGIWLSCFVLILYLERKLLHGNYGSNALKGLRVLELGAGHGLPGMSLAQLGADVVLTDQPHMCPLLKFNVAASSFPDGQVPFITPLRWGNGEDLRSLFCSPNDRDFDLIIGSDIGYDLEGHLPLMQTLDSLCKQRRDIQRPPEIIFALPQREGDEFNAFKAFVSAHGWSLEVVHETDLANEIGDVTCCVVAVVELKPPTLKPHHLKVTDHPQRVQTSSTFHLRR